jgi:hypothetical protein
VCGQSGEAVVAPLVVVAEDGGQTVSVAGHDWGLGGR